MKAQISRDSFDPDKLYSGVFQQQGRMLTDADWNEMVRILKHRMDRTVGAAVESGSPRYCGIIQGADASYEAFKKAPQFRWGRVYVDGLYGEVRRAAPVFQVDQVLASGTHDWSRVNLESDFSSPPVLLTALQTFRGTAETRLRGRTVSAFEVKVEEAQSRDTDPLHAGEPIGFLAAAPGEILDAGGCLIGEAGMLEVGQRDGSTWHTVAFKHQYSDPIVIMQLMSFHGPEPAHTRVDDVRRHAFKFQIEKWEYLDQSHPSEEIGYVVLEKGRHWLANETIVEVGTVETDHGGTKVEFEEDFPSEPVVLSHSQTRKAPDAVVTRQQNATHGSVEIRLQAEDASEEHDREMVGYIAASASQKPLIEDLSIKDFIQHQRDYPANPWNRLEVEIQYLVYIDLWERLVVSLEDAALTDIALHGTDTCVRTQTMAQVKLAPMGENVEALLPHGTARISVDVLPPTVAGRLHNCSTEPQAATAFAKKNALFRLELHSVTKADGEVSEVTLKWSTENGAEERRNGETLDGFLSDDYLYECFSTETEKHLGEHLLQGVNGWQPLRSTLYSRADYDEERKIPGTPAATMPRIRRWDDSVTLDRSATSHKTSHKWSVAGGSHPVATIEGGAPTGQTLKLSLKADDRDYLITLSLDAQDSRPAHFMTGDYWLVLLRDDGNDLTAEPLSADPVGVEHHYMAIGSTTKDREGALEQYTLDKPTWRRLSFPSLTRLTLDRVLVADNGKETDIEDLLLGRAIRKQGKVVFQGTLPPNAVVESDWIPEGDDGLMERPYTLIVGAHGNAGTILLGPGLSGDQVARVGAEIDPSTNKFRIRVQNGANGSTNITIPWWALEATGDELDDTHVDVQLVVDPPSITLYSGQEQLFKAIVGGEIVSSGDVEWFVNGSPVSGDAGLGAITDEGLLFTAPTVGDSTDFEILARSTHSPNMEGTASVTVTPHEGVDVTATVYHWDLIYVAPGLPPMVIKDVPLEGATVSLKRDLYEVVGTTNTDGEFVFQDIPPGTYTFSAEMDDYAPKDQQETISPDNTTIELTLHLDVIGRIYSVDENQEEVGLLGAEVELIGKPDETVYETPVGATTDANGEYVFQDVPPGTYTFSASKDGYTTNTEEVTISLLNKEIELELTPV